VWDVEVRSIWLDIVLEEFEDLTRRKVPLTGRGFRDYLIVIVIKEEERLFSHDCNVESKFARYEECYDLFSGFLFKGTPKEEWNKDLVSVCLNHPLNQRIPKAPAVWQRALFLWLEHARDELTDEDDPTEFDLYEFIEDVLSDETKNECLRSCGEEVAAHILQNNNPDIFEAYSEQMILCNDASVEYYLNTAPDKTLVAQNVAEQPCSQHALQMALENGGQMQLTLDTTNKSFYLYLKGNHPKEWTKESLAMFWSQWPYVHGDGRIEDRWKSIYLILQKFDLLDLEYLPKNYPRELELFLMSIGLLPPQWREARFKDLTGRMYYTDLIWCPENHFLHDPHFQLEVKTVLLVLRRVCPIMPKDLIKMLLRYCFAYDALEQRWTWIERML
jgi:hypothetical protein